MKRRDFIKLGTSAVGVVLFPCSVLAEQPTNKEQQITRLTSEALNQLSISFPTKTVTSQNGEAVTFPLSPRIARRFANKVYVLFDTEKQLRVFDLQSNQCSSIPVDKSIGTVRDFYVTDNGLVYFLSSSLHQVILISSSGDIVNRIGEFGWERKEQLNAPRSLTIDAEGRLHILNAGTNSVKVFNNSGAFLFEYGKNQWGSRRNYQYLDGNDVISVYEHNLEKVKWQFSLQGRLVNSFI